MANGNGDPVYEPERFWEERYSRLDLNRSGHRDLPEAYNRWLYRRKRNVLRRSLARIGFSPRGRSVLELGAGTGAYLDFWRRAGVGHLTGLDISRRAIDYLEPRHPDFSFYHRDITSPGLVEDLARAGGIASFDLVTALDVLYHVVDDRRLETALGNVAALLRPNGVLALHDQFLHRPSEEHGYIRWRSLADWQALLSAAGFEIASRTPIFFFMIQPNDCRSARAAERMHAVWWRVRSGIVRRPAVVGALTFAMDTAVGAVAREGPSMELMLARRLP
jgi:SAM-dependent methyltransferase